MGGLQRINRARRQSQRLRGGPDAVQPGNVRLHDNASGKQILASRSNCDLCEPAITAKLVAVGRWPRSVSEITRCTKASCRNRALPVSSGNREGRMGRVDAMMSTGAVGLGAGGKAKVGLVVFNRGDGAFNQASEGYGKAFVSLFGDGGCPLIGGFGQECLGFAQAVVKRILIQRDRQFSPPPDAINSGLEDP